MRGPQAVNGKGPAAQSAIKMGQGVLFSEEGLPEVTPERIANLNSSVWFLCVSVNDADEEDVRAEISLPAAIDGGNLRDFSSAFSLSKAAIGNRARRS